MCDTVCVLGDGMTLFAKNSDRPVTEAQTVGPHRRRGPGPGRSLRTQYLDIADEGAAATLLSRPIWLWGAEHGVNEHRVAIGNEMVDTVDDPKVAPPALIGMDLVRLGLERASNAEDALEVMTGLLERHGQGGVCDQVHDATYWSSFLVADPTSAWVLETSGRKWAARPVRHGDAISNRLTIRSDWTRASADVAPGTDLDSWRNPATDTGFADGRLAASRAFVAALASTPAAAPRSDPRAAVAHLRDHGSGPWGAPGEGGTPVPPPGDVLSDGTGVTVCMHIGDFEATAASLVAELPAERRRPARAWVALGSPCSSVYVPVLLPAQGASGSDPADAVIPAGLATVELWHRFCVVARHVEREAGVLEEVRSVLGPLEAELWDEADTLELDITSWRHFAPAAQHRVEAALDNLARSGIGVDDAQVTGHNRGPQPDRRSEAHR